MKKKLLVLCTTDSMIWNFLIPHIKEWELKYDVECACSNTGFYFNELKEIYNLNVIEIPFSRNPIKIKNIKSFFNLNKLTKLKKYDLIICQEPVGGLMGRLVAINKGIKVIYTAHGFHFYKGAAIKNWLLYYPIERILAHFTDVLITSNQEDFELAQKFKAKKIKKINGVGINLEKFNNESSSEIKIKLKKELNIPLNSKVILNAAELIERKNHKIALETFAQLPENSSYFVICGTGEQEEELKKLSKSLNIEKRTIFLGFRKDLDDLYKLADVFFFPSLQEGLSVALLGAMASGLPVVCSNIRGNIDLIEDGKGGYIFDPMDSKGFALGLSNILENSNDFGEYNNSVVGKFEVNKVVEVMNSIVTEVLER